MNQQQKTSIGSWWQEFWFRPISAAGFGMMRVGFGCSGFLTMLMEWPNVQRFYGPHGILPTDMIGTVMRDAWRFSLLDGAPAWVVSALYLALLIALLCVMIGVCTRPALIISTILLYSFHEYGTLTLDGGDTLQRLIALILVISPCDRSFTLANAKKRLRLAREEGRDQTVATRTMPIWPYRLLLWQMILLYTAAALEKWSGITWTSGSAVAIVLHHSLFSRLSMGAADLAAHVSPFISWFTMYSQGAWALLLPFGLLTISEYVSTHAFNTWKRTLMLCGLLIHGGILVFMDVGTFSFTVFVAYLGLLLDDDFRAIRGLFNRRWKEPIIVLYDGRCGFCKKSVMIISMLDWFHRLEFNSYHDQAIREKYAPGIDLHRLNAEMHIRLPHGKLKAGFFAFRTLCRHLPVLWILAPILKIPGLPVLGKKAYSWVSEHRR